MRVVSVWTRWRIIVLVIGMWLLAPVPLLAAPSPGASHRWSAADGTLSTCLRPVHGNESARDVLRAPRGFDCSGHERHWGPGNFWVIARDLLHDLPRDSEVRSGSVYQRSATLYVLYADGGIHAAGFDSAQVWRHLRIGAFFAWTIPDRASPAVRLLWRVNGATNTRGVLIKPRLLGPDQARTRDLQLTAFYAGFVGLCVALLLLNSALWRALRQPFMAPYCAMVVCLLIYAASSSGVLGMAVGMDNNLRLRLNIVLLAAAMFSAVLFARCFFGTNVMTRATRRLADGALTFLIAAVLAYLTIWPRQPLLLDRLLLIGFSLNLLLVLPVMIGAWRARAPHARLFALAWTMPIALCGVRIVQAPGWIGWSFWIDNSSLIAMALEAVASSLVIAWRIKLVGAERDRAREREMVARIEADVDPLTGLLNRRAFLRDAIGGEAPRRLVLIDIDHFRSVNDTLGHDGGDEVLRRFAEALRGAAPAGAAIARLGGEEFAILAEPGVDPLPDRLLDAIRVARMPYDLQVTASLGCSVGYVQTDGDWAALYREADRALYGAKSAGRDRARHAA